MGGGERGWGMGAYVSINKPIDSSKNILMSRNIIQSIGTILLNPITQKETS